MPPGHSRLCSALPPGLLEQPLRWSVSQDVCKRSQQLGITCAMAEPLRGREHLQEDLKRVLDENVNKDKLKAKFDVSHFGANAVLRGMQLTLVGGRISPPIPRNYCFEYC